MNAENLKYYRNINKITENQTYKESLVSGIVQDYNNAREHAIYRFNIIVNSIDGKDIYLNDSIIPIRGVVDTRRKQTATSEMEQTLQVFPNLLNRGDYAKFKMNENDELHDYIITSSIEKKNGYDEGVFVICNQIIQWKQNNIIYSYPCVIENDSYGSKTLVNNSYISDVSAKSKITVQYNEFTKNIMLDWRFCFNHSETDIYKVLDKTTSISDGLITFITEKNKYQVGLDDLVNNIAYNSLLDNPVIPEPPEPTTYSIDGLDSIKQLVDSTYTINPLLTDCTFEIDEFSVQCGIASIISQGNGSCIVKATKSMSNESFTLIAKDSGGVILVSKDIISLKV